MTNPFDRPRFSDAELHIKLARVDEYIVRGIPGAALQELNDVNTELARRRQASPTPKIPWQTLNFILS